MKNGLVTPLLLIAVAFVLTQNCAPMQVGSDLAADGTLNALSLSPMTDTLNTGSSLQFVGTGGTPPYTYLVMNGLGTVSTTGFYTAPTSIAVSTTTTTATVTVEIEDSVGAIATAVLTIVNGTASGISATYTPNPATTNTTVTMTPSGGVPPYTYILVTGSGALSANFYTTSSFNETATIQITDSANETGTIAISTTNSNSGIVSLTLSRLGASIPGGGGCAAQYQMIGEVADVSEINGTGIYGDQIFCGQTGTLTAGSQLLTNLYLTAGGSHVEGGLGCPSGYNKVVGQVEDCEVTGTCGGQQTLCAYYTPYVAGSSVVQNFYITPENEHAIGGVPCAAGYSMIGNSADCGNGTCYGTQSYCVLYGN
jgi:hypothetical protein